MVDTKAPGLTNTIFSPENYSIVTSDQHLLPGRFYYIVFDQRGFFSTLDTPTSLRTHFHDAQVAAYPGVTPIDPLVVQVYTGSKYIDYQIAFKVPEDFPILPNAWTWFQNIADHWSSLVFGHELAAGIYLRDMDAGTLIPGNPQPPQPPPDTTSPGTVATVVTVLKWSVVGFGMYLALRLWETYK